MTRTQRDELYNTNDSSLDHLKKRIKKKIYKHLIKGKVDSLKDLITVAKKEISKYLLKQNGESLDEKDLDKYATIIILSNFGLEKLANLIVDEEINEIYIDGVEKPVYLDHVLKGRVLTDIRLNREEIEQLIFFLKFFSGLFITKTKPSDKVELDIGHIKLRISVDIPPLVNEYSLVIRKQHSRRYSLSNVFKVNRAEVMLLLYILATMRKNILILGEPGSGKTYLASSILEVLPSYWRLIIIEDVREITISKDYGVVRFKVNPFETRIKKEFSKEKQILKALHRSPDYVFVGEIHDKVDAEAYFHGLSSGLKILATSHSTGFQEFLDRIKNSFKLDLRRLCLIDVIVFMRKKITRRGSIRVIDKLFLTDQLLRKGFSRESVETRPVYDVGGGNGCVYYGFSVFGSSQLDFGTVMEIVMNFLNERNPASDLEALNLILRELYSTTLNIQSQNYSEEEMFAHVSKIRNLLEKFDELLMI